MRVGPATVVATITLDDGTVHVTPDDERPFDRIVFERKFDRTWPPLDEDETETDEDGDPKVTVDWSEDLWLFMAWVQLHRAEIASGTLTHDAFDAWMVRVVEAEWDFRPPEPTPEGADAAPPTDPAASGGA